MQLFGKIMRTGVLTINLNFETFPAAFCALWTVATGDGWSDIMLSTMLTKDFQYDCL
jgi:hypothetical protein